MINHQIEPLQQQIEPLCADVSTNQKELIKCIDDLADAMKLLSAQMSQLSASFQSFKSTPPTARGNGHT